jgi:hypothetical protein
VSLDAGKAQPFGRSRAGKPAMALTVAAAAVVALTACGSSPGRRPPVAAQAAALSSAPASASRTLAETGSSLINGSAAQAYPIINYEYAVVDTSQPSATRARDLRAFLRWAVTTGTAQLAAVNFQPLPPSTITLSDAQIARIKG